MDKVIDKSMEVSHVDELARVKYEANKQQLNLAFENYRLNPAQYETQFYLAVLEFARLKLRYLEAEFSSSSAFVTVDDFAQEVAIAVYENMQRDGATLRDADSFYAWVHRIAYLKAAQLFNELDERKDKYTTLMVTSQDEESGEDEEIDNPEVLNSGHADNGLHIPGWTTELDRAILGMMTVEVYDPERPNYKYGVARSKALDPDNPKGGVRGMDYKEIAESLRMSKAPEGEDWSAITENAVELRVRRLRNKVKRERKTAMVVSPSQARAKAGIR